jgi:hypothetical protein
MGNYATLQAVRQAEGEAQACGPPAEPVGADLRAQLGQAGPTLRQQWDSGALTNVRTKELLRALIDKVVLRRTATDKCEVRIVWVTDRTWKRRPNRG